MSVTTRLVLHSTTGITLHERFSQLKKVTPPAQPRKRDLPQPRPPPVYREHTEQQYYRPSQAIQYRSPYQPRGRSLAFEAATRIKKRSIQQRLGIRRDDPYQFKRYNQYQPRYYGNPGGWRGRGGWQRRNKFSMRRSNSYGNLSGAQRWRSSNSLASDGMGRRRRSYSFSASGRGRGRGRGRRPRGRGFKQQNPTKEELDAQLDSYMSNTRIALDKDLDAYRNNV